MLVKHTTDSYILNHGAPGYKVEVAITVKYVGLFPSDQSKIIEFKKMSFTTVICLTVHSSDDRNTVH